MPKQKSIDIRKLRKGDSETFRELFESFFIPLRDFVAGYVGSADMAADIAQESLMSFWGQRTEFDNIQKIRSWLYQVCRNAALNELSHRKVVENYAVRLFEQESGYVSGDANVFTTELMELRSEVLRRLREEIEALPRRTRQIMELVLQGKQNDEIAATLDIGRETVHTLKRIAVTKLRSRMGHYQHVLNEITS